MNHLHLRCITSLSILVLATSLTAACATAVVPITSSGVMAPDENHGILSGTIRLILNGKDSLAGLERSTYMKWWLEEETSGKRILLSRFPLNGPFAVKLPTGSYRIRDISFHSSRGVWHAAVETPFRIQPQACTSLGTWELETQRGFLSGWVTLHVSDAEEFAPGTEETLETQGCSSQDTVIDVGVKHSVKLHLRPRGPDRF